MNIFPQDTVKKKSPIVVEDRQGFGDSDTPAEESKESNKVIDKRSPFGVAEVDADKAKAKKKKDKEKNNKDSNSKKTPKKEENEKSAVKKETKKEQTAVKPNIIPKKENKSETSKIVTEIPKKEEQKPIPVVKTEAEKPVKKHYTEHKRPANYLAPKYRNYINQDGLFIMFLTIGLLFGWINIFHRKRFIQVLNAFFVTRIINQLIREENSLLQRVFVMVSVIFILIFSIFVFQAAVFYGIKLPGGGHVLLFFACALGVSIIYFSKFMIINFTGYLFDAEKLTKDYFYNIFLINNFVGLLFVPLVLLIAYTHLIPKEVLIYSGSFIYLLSFAYRVIRGFSIGLNESKYSVFHIFLYLCTLEILPLILMMKLINQSINF